jgi:hypothetical protein
MLLVVAVGHGSAGSVASTRFKLFADYLARLNDDDVAGAMKLRCDISRPMPADLAGFLGSVQNIRAAAGGTLKVAQIEDVPDVRVGSMFGVKAEHELRYSLRLANGHSSWVHIATVTEKGADHLCGSYLPESVAGRKLARTSPEIGRKHIADLLVTLESIAKIGDAPVEQVPPNSNTPAPIDAKTTTWHAGAMGGVRVTIARFRTDELARVWAFRLLAVTALDSVGVFPASEIQGALGLSMAAQSWTWVQPADVGNRCDRILAASDDAAVLIDWCGLQMDEDHAKIKGLAAQVALLL